MTTTTTAAAAAAAVAASVTSVKVVARDLAAAIRAVLPAAGGIAEPLIFQSVHLVTRDGQLVAEASNRYVLAEDRIASGVEADIDLVVGVPEAKQIERSLRGHLWDVTLDQAAGTISHAPGVLWARPEQVGIYPKLGSLLVPGQPAPHDSLAIDPSWLAILDPKRLRRRDEEHQVLHLTFQHRGTTPAVYARFSDHYRALLMGQRN